MISNEEWAKYRERLRGTVKILRIVDVKHREPKSLLTLCSDQFINLNEAQTEDCIKALIRELTKLIDKDSRLAYRIEYWAPHEPSEAPIEKFCEDVIKIVKNL